MDMRRNLRQQMCARAFDEYQQTFQLKETFFDYLIVIVARKLAEIYPYEINVNITLLRLVTT